MLSNNIYLKMPFFSTAKKYIKKGTKAAGKRYGVSYGRRGLKMSKSSLSRIDKDVQMIKSRLNVEKKFIDGSITTGSTAQVNLSAPGYFTSTITPVIAQGITESTRVGSSIKLTGMNMQLQFLGQTNTHSSRRLKMCIISSTDSSVTNAINDLWDVNPLTNVVDYYSNRNYSNNPRAHKVIRTTYKKISGEGTSATVANREYKAMGTTRIGLKLQQVARFEGTASTLKDMNYFLVIFCDTGNNHPTSTSSNTGCLIPDAVSGVEIQEYFRWFFVDN